MLIYLGEATFTNYIKPQSSISIFIKHLEERLSHDVIFIFLQELLLSDLPTWIALEKLVKSDHGIYVGHSVLLDKMLHCVKLKRFRIINAICSQEKCGPC